MPCSRRQLAQPLEKLLRRDDIAAFALNRLDHDRRDFVGRDEVHEDLILDEVEALGRAVLGLQAERAAIAIRIRRVIHARHHRPEAAPLNRLARGQRQRAHRAAVKAAEKRDDVLPPGGIPRELDAASVASVPELPKNDRTPPSIGAIAASSSASRTCGS